MAQPAKEGWYEDPARRHQYRWFSDGLPTDLVKDDRTTSRDTISIRHPSLYESMGLAEPQDDSPLLHTSDVKTPHFEVLNFGVGPVAVVDTVAGPPDPRLRSKPASAIEILVVLIPVVVGIPIAWMGGAPVIGVLGILGLSLILAFFGARRRRRQGHRRIGNAESTVTD